MPKQNKIIVILGRKGCGKTTFANKLAQKCYFGQNARVVIVEPMDGFSLSGSPVIRTDDITAFENLQGRSFLCLPDDDEVAITTFEFCWHVQENSTKPLWLFIDEIDMYFSWRNPDPFIMKIIRYGRHRNINLVAISQRPANINNDLLAQADEKIIFNTIEVNDLTYLKKYAGVQPETLQGLGLYEFVRI